MNDTALMRARALGKEYGKGEALVRAVDDADLDVMRGETVAIVGPSGCGKSTLLHLLGGLERPSRGELRLAGQRIDQLGETALARLRRHAVGFVFQAFHLMDELTAVENVELPALLAGTSPRAARRRACELLEQIGLADRARHLPSALSGGQRQRVAIARALVGEPLVVLADEPTGNLDSAAILGLAVGWLVAPLLSSPSNALLGAAGAPSITVSTVLITLGVAGGVAVLATLVPAIRAAQASTIRSLNDPARPPRRRPLVNATSSRLPVPLLLGLRLAARRPRRSVLTAASLVITVAMIVAALTMRYVFDTRDQLSGTPDLLTVPLQNRVSQVVAVLTVILGILAAINMIFITQAAVADAQRASALARAFGTTPRGVTAGLCVAQLLPALAGVIVGIPAGVGLYRLAATGASHGGHVHALTPPLWWLLIVLLGTLLVVAVLTAIPARAGARRPVALVLRTE